MQDMDTTTKETGTVITFSPLICCICGKSGGPMLDCGGIDGAVHPACLATDPWQEIGL